MTIPRQNYDMDKGQFVFQITNEIEVDIASLSDSDWKRIKADVKFLMQSKQCDDIGRAYICAFLVFVQDIEILAEPFDSAIHKHM